MSRTFFRTRSATRAERIIYNSKVVYNFYRTVRASLFAKTAADTALFAILSGYHAFFRVGTAYYNIVFERNKTDDMLRTGGNTYAAALAFFGNYLCNSVFDFYCIERTDFLTLSESDTAERTLLCAFSETGDGGKCVCRCELRPRFCGLESRLVELECGFRLSPCVFWRFNIC